MVSIPQFIESLLCGHILPKLLQKEAPGCGHLAPGHTVRKAWRWPSSLYLLLQSFPTTVFHCLSSGLGFDKIFRVRFLWQTETPFLVFPDSIGFGLGPRRPISSWLERGIILFNFLLPGLLHKVSGLQASLESPAFLGFFSDAREAEHKEPFQWASSLDLESTESSCHADSVGRLERAKSSHSG